MATTNSNESINTEREKANLLCLIKLTLNALIDHSSTTFALPVLDDRNPDVTNFILTLERILCLRMKANWLSERRFFWDFIRPACIGCCQQTIIERVEEVSKARSLKDKGRMWIKFALMEKKLSELLKLVISDTNLVRKFYHDDSVMTSSQAFILCDQLAGLSAIDFSFCFKHDGPIIAPILLNDAEIDVIDLTPFLSYKSKQTKQVLTDQNSNAENKQPTESITEADEAKPSNVSEREGVSIERYKLEIEQRKYFEELLRHRDRELQQLHIRYETLKGERESEIIQMENIILELQHELRAARDEIEQKRKKVNHSGHSTPPKNPPRLNKGDSPPTPTNTHAEDADKQSLSTNASRSNNSNATNEKIDLKPADDFHNPSSQSSRRSSHSTATTNTEDDQYELVRTLTATADGQNNQNNLDIKPVSSPEMLSSATSLSLASTSGDEDDQQQHQEPTIIDEIAEMTPTIIDQTDLIEEKNT